MSNDIPVTPIERAAGSGGGVGVGVGVGVVKQIAAAVCAHPAVICLDSGPLHTIASYLPTGRFDGVYVGDPIFIARLDDHAAGSRCPRRVEVGVVLRLGQPLPRVVAELRALVVELLKDLTGGTDAIGASRVTPPVATVDITVTDVR